MSWYGKLLGGTFGFVIGGPIGALVGAALGHGFDRGMQDIALEADRAPGDAGEGPSVSFDPRERAQMAFFTATFAVMGHVAKADGRVSPAEIALARSVMDRMQLDDEMRSGAQRLFSQGKAPDFPLDDILKQLRKECHFSRNLIQMFLEIQLHAALADGDIAAPERSVLEHIAERLGFAPEVFRQLEELVRSADRAHAHRRTGASSAAPSLDSDYATLGIKAEAGDDDVKRAYRRLMSQHHPDKLVSKGLPEEMIKLATEKTQQIKAAYDRVRASRKS